MRSVCVPAILTSLFVAIASAQECTKTRQRCDTIQTVTEYPGGVVNGANPTFTLKRRPVPGRPVRLFLNGVELSRTRDFETVNSEVTVTRSIPVKGGDILSATYDAEVDKTRVSINNERREVLVNGALLESLHVEPLQLKGPQPNPASIPPDTVGESVRGGPKSLQMLSRDLQDARKVSLSSGTSEDLSGLEGTGDLAIPTTYDLLFGNADRSNKAGESAARAATRTEKHFRSIEMLRRTLNVADEESGSGKRVR